MTIPHPPPRHLPRLLATCAVCLVLAQCAAPVSVRRTDPHPPAAVARGTVPIDQVRDAYLRISRGDDGAVASYNYWVARFIEDLGETGADPWSGSIAMNSPGGVRTLRGRSPAGTAPGSARLIPTDTLAFRGKYEGLDSKVEGIGAPLVMVTSFEGIGHIEARQKQPLRNLTAVVRFEGGGATLELVDPYQIETVAVSGTSRPLAADYGAAVMLGMSKARIDKLGLARLLRPSRYNDTVHLNFLQPYDPQRIPVLMVHGLDSTPATFATMYFSLLEDPQIRKNYQFWVFSYPSGYPYPYSASLLRKELDQVRTDFPDHRDMVIIGHSMGGMISRLMVTDAGDTLWRKAFGKPPGETHIAGHSKQLLEQCLVFENRREIDRALFFSAPHRGSDLATNSIGRIFSRLVKMPGLIADVRNVALSVATADQAGLMIQSAPNSIGTLSPSNAFVVAVNELPIAPGVPYHSVIGDRGKGDTPDSSDGVVPYWSSHLDGAASEKIVPSGHGSHDNPEGIAEAHRILLLHLQQ